MVMLKISASQNSFVCRYNFEAASLPKNVKGKENLIQSLDKETMVLVFV